MQSLAFIGSRFVTTHGFRTEQCVPTGDANLLVSNRLGFAGEPSRVLGLWEGARVTARIKDK